MPLFRCTKCGCIENTATGNYWAHQKEPICSECDTGQWHGRFPKRSAVGMLIDQNGHLWSQGQVDGGALPKHYKIVGKVKDHGGSMPYLCKCGKQYDEPESMLICECHSVPTEAQVLKAVYETGLHQYAPGVIKMVRKDGINIDEPIPALMSFVRKLTGRE